ncbi:MAG: oligosaccharide flippase family protein [Candidatus Riflebacteria bacterium]|nr:oligosaccharide flippase family protein [Candidatus Riflebacteria bacterium]
MAEGIVPTAAPVAEGRRERTLINLLSSAVAWGWPVLLAFATTPYLIRVLGNDAYGIRGLMLTISGYFALLDLGLNGAVAKFVAEYHAGAETDRMSRLLGTTLTTYLGMGLTGGVAIWLLAPWLAGSLFTIPDAILPEATWVFRLTGLGFLLSMLMWWGSAIPTGLQRFDVVNGIGVVYGTVTTLGAVAAVWWGKGLTGVVWANLLATFLALGLYGLGCRRLLPGVSLRPGFDAGMFRRTVAFGVYMVGFRMFALLFTQLDSMLIGTYIGTSALTFYLVPQQIASVIQQVNGKMMEFVFPMASELARKGDARQLETLVLRGFNLSLFIALSGAVPLAVVARPLLSSWVSAEMAERSTTVLLLLTVSFGLSGLTALPSYVLGGLNYPQGLTFGGMVAGVSGLVAYVLLIGPYGIEGAAAGKALSVVLTVAFYLALCHWKAPFSLARLGLQAGRLVIIGLAVGLPAWWFVTPRLAGLPMVVGTMVLIAAVFFLACWVLGALDPAEKDTFRALVRRVRGGPAR